jgi:acyl transferase domain-containing protein
MAAVGMSPTELGPFLLDGVVVACENSPQSTTISGDVVQVEKVLNDIAQKQPDTFLRKLRVEVAYHSCKNTITPRSLSY